MSRDRTSGIQALLDQIDIEGFRSCHTTTFKLHPELSALIGINGAGKTNILHAIRLLQVRRSRQRRTSADDLSTSSEARVTAWFLIDEKRIGLRTTFGLVDSARRGDELATLSETWNLQSITGTRGWKPFVPIELLEDGEYRLSHHAAYLAFSKSMATVVSRRPPEVLGYDPELLSNEAVKNAVRAVTNFRKGIAYYSASQFTDPTRCPSSFEVDEDGRLLDVYAYERPVHLKFLHDLYTLRKANPDSYDEYCRFVSRQQLGLISRLTWKEIELSSNTAEIKRGGIIQRIRKTKTLVIPKVQIGSSYITFNQLSEGTFKTLALAFYIITDASSFLMVEEPEVCIHHGLLSRIVGTLKAYSKNKQTVISTHSDLLVDELEPANVFVVEMARNGTRVKGLEDWLGRKGEQALHAYLNESGTLGEYWKTGGLS